MTFTAILVQFPHNSLFSTTAQETPSSYVMFGRPARLPVDVILGIPYEGRKEDTEELAQRTRDKLQLPTNRLAETCRNVQ